VLVRARLAGAGRRLGGTRTLVSQKADFGAASTAVKSAV
jgi:hypothetical protein